MYYFGENTVLFKFKLTKFICKWDLLNICTTGVIIHTENVK